MDPPEASTSSFSTNFESSNSELQAAALNATKLAASLPADLDFHRSLDKQFAQALDSCSDKVLNLTNRLLSFVSTVEGSKGKGKRKLEDEEDVVDKFNSVIVDVVDQLFEKADRGLDEYLGRLKPAAIEVRAEESKAKATNRKRNKQDAVITHASYLPKPQLKFSRKVNNNEPVWRPTISHKYNAQVPLGYNMRPNEPDADAEAEILAPHPYRYEVSNIAYPSRMFAHTEPQTIRTFEDTPFTWIDTKDGLDALLEKLRNSDEIAVDLEHHSYRSFSGFLCLMQISTRTEDFVIDTLALRDELEELNEVFTNPRIVKVFHGAESDIVWLQQDFNLYIVNLFDTYHASKVLDFPKHSLAALLEMYCDFIPDKRYQLADWRIRPLPKEMLDYARSDTHYLLYIYDSLRNALLDRAHSQPELVREVLSRSQETCLRTYQPDVYDAETGTGPNGWNTLAQKWNKSFVGHYLAVYKCMHAWRDRVAREEDESLRYVLPNHCVFKLAEQPPADMASLLRLFHPPPQLVRARASELLDTIRSVVESTLGGDDSQDAAPAVLPEAPMSTTVEVTHGVDEALPLGDENQQSLWSGTSNNRATSSTLLVSNGGHTGGTTRWTSISSSLFSNAKPTGLSQSRNQSEQWRTVVSQIHRDLVITPTLPTIPNTPTAAPSEGKTTEIEQESEVAVVSAAAQAEIPFVPPSQRSKQLVEVDDTIVVVGQHRQKKRKRLADSKLLDNDSQEAAPQGEPKPESKKSKRQAEASIAEEPFDYASVPNILDASPATPAVPTANKHDKSKKKDMTNGKFPRAPKSLREQKSGNITHTFR